MGTRSITRVMDVRTNGVYVTLYRQYDGDPSGHGAELSDFLMNKELVNGLSFGEETWANKANGGGDLAALMISYFKGNRAGEFYLVPPEATDMGQEFEYDIGVHDFTLELMVVVRENYSRKEIFRGNREEFQNFVNSYEG